MSDEKKSYWMKDQTGNFTLEGKDTFDPAKRYVGIRLQQGIPLLDRDWNELDDIRRYEEQMLRQHYIGNGSPDDGFKISAVNPDDPSSADNDNNFRIGTGRCLVDGFEVVNDTSFDDYIEKYSDQRLTDLSPSTDEDREDNVYLDVWVKEVRSKPLEPNPENMDVEVDPDLSNANDVAEETCVRHKLVWRVRVDEGSQFINEENQVKNGDEFHYYYLIAKITRKKGTNTISEADIEDLREKKSFRWQDRIYITESGNVGIGTPNPKIHLAIGDNETGLNQQGNGELAVYTDNQERVRIDKNGNVGIGTTTPGAKLHVNGDQIIDGKVSILDPSFLDFGSNPRQMINLLTLKGIPQYGIGIQNSTQYYRSDKNFAWYIGGEHVDGVLNAGTGGTVAMVIENGKVGIGTTTPKNKLDVNGSVVIGEGYSGTNDAPTNGLSIEGNVGIGTTNPNAKLHVSDGKAATLEKDTGFLVVGSLDSSNIVMDDKEILARNNGAKSPLSLQTEGGDLLVHNQEEESKFVVKDSGNVGIGTPAPKNKLDVKGSAVIGATYSGTEDAPANGLLVEGNVGIGTAEPGAKLDVNGAIYSGNSDIYFTKTDHDYTNIGNTEGYAAIQNAQDFCSLMILGRKTSNGRKVSLWDYLQVQGGMDITGNVGIGTSDPNSKLHISGGNAAQLKSDSGFLVVGSVESTNIVMDDKDILARNNGEISGLHLQTDGGDLLVHSNQKDESKKFVVKDSGNVGIGTTDPLAKLHVIGDLLGAVKDTDGNALKIVVGKIEAKEDDWIEYPSYFKVKVDTTNANFTDTPFYFVSLTRDDELWDSASKINSVQLQTNISFVIFIQKKHEFSKEDAITNNFSINWIGIGT